MTGFVLWFFGLPCSGKTTLAKALFHYLKSNDAKVEILDGDEFRRQISTDLRFSKADRLENIKRACYVANLLARNDINVVCAFVTPYEEMRKYLRKNCINFVSVFMDTPLEVCEKRDVKSHYSLAKKGNLKNFTGVSDCFEMPDQCDLVIKGGTVEGNIRKVVDYLKKRNYI